MAELNKKNVFFQDANRLNAPLEIFLHSETGSKGAVGPHWHYYLEILYLLTGTLEAQCDNTFYTMHPGDLILFYPQSVHSMHRSPQAASPDETVQYVVLMVDLNFLNITTQYRTRFSKLFKMAYMQDPSYILFQKKELQELPVLSLLTHSLEERLNQGYGSSVLLCSNVASLLTYLMRGLIKKGLDMNQVVTSTDETDDAIYEISKYIEQHCGESLRVQDLAAQCGMSYSYFAKLFRETYNQSCKEYIEFARLNKVTDLLLFTELDLNYISQETGFSDCSHLIRTFRKWKGMTPKQWRTEMKK